MLQRDYLLNETRKLAELLARLTGLKADGLQEQYAQQFNEALQKEYNTNITDLSKLGEADFANTLRQTTYSIEKLDALSQLLFLSAHPFDATATSYATLKKVLIIYNVLEKKHHYKSFEHIYRSQQIQGYLQDHDLQVIL